MRRKYRSGLAMASMLAILVAFGGQEVRSVAALSTLPDPTITNGASAEARPSPTASTSEATSTPQATLAPTGEPTPEPTPDVMPTPDATPTPKPLGPPLLVDVFAEAEFPCEGDGFCPNDPRVGHGLAFTGEFDAALVDRTEPFDGLSAMWGLVLPGTASGSIGGSFGAVLTVGPGEVYPLIDVTCFENRLRPDGDLMEPIPSTLEGQSVLFRLDVDPTDEFVYVDCDFYLNFVDASPLPSFAARPVSPTLPPTDFAVEGQEPPSGGGAASPLHVLAGLVTAVALVATWPTRRGRGTQAAGQHRR